MKRGLVKFLASISILTNLVIPARAQDMHLKTIIEFLHNPYSVLEEFGTLDENGEKVLYQEDIRLAAARTANRASNKPLSSEEVYEWAEEIGGKFLGWYDRDRNLIVTKEEIDSRYVTHF